MSNKSSLIKPQYHKSIQELAHEDKIKREQERQRILFRDTIIPFLKENTVNMFEAVSLVTRTNTALETIYKEMVMDEQKRISETKVSGLGIDEKLETQKLTKERALINLLKEESVGSLSGLLLTFNKWTSVSRETEDKNRDIETFPFADLV